MKETFYFSHDYNARNDEKILELRAEFGAEGYGVFWMLIESMAESSEGYLNRGAMGGLSLGYGVAKDTLCKIVDFCINVGLFLMKDDTYFYSKRLQEHKDLRKMLSEKGKQGAIKMWERKKQEQILEEKKDVPKGDTNGGAISGGNAKESKEKESKENIIIEESEIPTQPKKDSSKKFVPPTLEQVATYIKEYCTKKNRILRNFENESESFMNYHIARDWKLKGGVKMSDWQACVRTWVLNMDKFSNNTEAKPQQNKLFTPIIHTKKDGTPL